jgi:hypothetical protein
MGSKMDGGFFSFLIFLLFDSGARKKWGTKTHEQFFRFNEKTLLILITCEAAIERKREEKKLEAKRW